MSVRSYVKPYTLQNGKTYYKLKVRYYDLKGKRTEKGVSKIENLNEIPTIIEVLVNQINSEQKQTVGFLYRMLDKNKSTIYIGKTKDLKRRMYQHFYEKTSKFGEELSDIKEIQFIPFSSNADLGIAEIALITKYRPKFNKDYCESEGLVAFKNLKVVEDWQNYKIIS